MRQLSRNIKRVAMVPLVGFALLCVYIAYWQVLRAPALRADEHNTRAQERLEKIRPGRILDADGEVLLDVRQAADGSWERLYPASEAVAHLTGYNDSSGLQKGVRDALLNVGRYEHPLAEFIEGPTRGNDVSLTIDLDAQRLATHLLRRQRGALVALDAKTGAVLTMVSAPTYDPADVLASDFNYQLFQQNPNVPELNRALLGLYPPGSVLKIFTAAVCLDLGRVSPDTSFDCDGRYEIDGAEITCPRAHGSVTLEEALAVSCNTTFARLGRYMVPEEFLDYGRRFLLTEPAQLPLPSRSGRLGEFTGEDSDVLLAETAFGQGRAHLTPFAIARMTLAIANGGRVLEPYLVDEIMAPDGRVIAKSRTHEVGRAISAETAATVAGMMVRVVEDGTGKVAQIRGVDVAGKTGSAENPQGEAHSWFTAFAPAQSPQVVVTAVVENAGHGSEVAAPVVREVMVHLLERAGALY